MCMGWECELEGGVWVFGLCGRPVQFRSGVEYSAEKR